VRKRAKQWELEARDATEDLRAVLIDLDQREQAMPDAEEADADLFGALNRSIEVTSAVRAWLPDWDVRAEKSAGSDSLAYLVYRTCLPVLLLGVEVFTSGLGVRAAAPDRAEGDEELVAVGIAAVHAAMPLALDLVGDASYLRIRDRQAVFDAVLDLKDLSVPLRDAGGPLGVRLRELRSPTGPGDGGHP
jgi:hypothetical protein